MPEQAATATTTSPANTVKIALMLAGLSQADIADQCNVAASAVNLVVHGRSRSKRIENRISAATGVAREQLWPQWYGPRANARKPRLSPTEIAKRLAAIVETNGEAA